MQFPILIILACFFSTGTSAADPDWVKPSVRELRYPKSDFYQGFVSRNFEKEENRVDVENEIIAQSRIRLAESIHVYISSEATSLLYNRNSDSDEAYQRKSVTRTELKASGLETVTFFDERKSVAYAFSYVKKRKLQSSYYKELKSLMFSIKKSLYGSETVPYSTLVDLLEELSDAKSLQQMLKFLGIDNSLVLMTSQWTNYKLEIDKRMAAAKQMEFAGLSDAAKFIRDGLIADINTRAINKIKINRITFKNTGIATELSVLFDNYFQEEMDEKFIIDNADYNWEVNSTYWPLNDHLKITTTIHQSDNGELIRLIASTSANVSRRVIDGLGIDYVPIKDEEDIREHQAVTSLEAGDMVVELATQKGKQSNVFQEGESLNLQVKVSRPAYIQLINVWADGSKLLLQDNYYLDAAKTNQFVQLPFEWETACPCGVEYIYAIASSEPHKVPSTTEQEGFFFINDPLDQLLAQKRGFKKLNEETYSSETFLIVTTLPKE